MGAQAFSNIHSRMKLLSIIAPFPTLQSGIASLVQMNSELNSGRSGTTTDTDRSGDQEGAKTLFPAEFGDVPSDVLPTFLVEDTDAEHGDIAQPNPFWVSQFDEDSEAEELKFASHFG